MNKKDYKIHVLEKEIEKNKKIIDCLKGYLEALDEKTHAETVYVLKRIISA